MGDAPPVQSPPVWPAATSAGLRPAMRGEDRFRDRSPGHGQFEAVPLTAAAWTAHPLGGEGGRGDQWQPEAAHVAYARELPPQLPGCRRDAVRTCLRQRHHSRGPVGHARPVRPSRGLPRPFRARTCPLSPRASFVASCATFRTGATMRCLWGSHSLYAPRGGAGGARQDTAAGQGPSRPLERREHLTGRPWGRTDGTCECPPDLCVLCEIPAQGPWTPHVITTSPHDPHGFAISLLSAYCSIRGELVVSPPSPQSRPRGRIWWATTTQQRSTPRPRRSQAIEPIAGGAERRPTAPPAAQVHSPDLKEG